MLGSPRCGAGPSGRPGPPTRGTWPLVNSAMKRWLPLFATLIVLLPACGDTAPGEAITTTGAVPGTTQGTGADDSLTAAPAPLQDVTLPTADGLTLEGPLCNTGSPTRVILAHRYPADLTSWPEFALTLHEATGYSVPA